MAVAEPRRGADGDRDDVLDGPGDLDPDHVGRGIGAQVGRGAPGGEGLGYLLVRGGDDARRGGARRSHRRGSGRKARPRGRSLPGPGEDLASRASGAALDALGEGRAHRDSGQGGPGREGRAHRLGGDRDDHAVCAPRARRRHRRGGGAELTGRLAVAEIGAVAVLRPDLAGDLLAARPEGHLGAAVGETCAKVVPQLPAPRTARGAGLRGALIVAARRGAEAGIGAADLGQ